MNTAAWNEDRGIEVVSPPKHFVQLTSPSSCPGNFNDMGFSCRLLWVLPVQRGRRCMYGGGGGGNCSFLPMPC